MALAALAITVPGVAAEPVRTSHAEAELVAKYSRAARGVPVRAALRIDPDPGWHVYWRNPGDSGLPPKLVPESAAAELEFVWPIPREIRIGWLTDYGYTEEVVLPFDIVSPERGDTFLYRARAEWLICKDVCVPEEIDLVLELPLGDSSETGPAAPVIARALAAVPEPLNGPARAKRRMGGYDLSVAEPALAAAVAGARSVRFLPYEAAIDHGAPQPVRVGPSGVTISLVSGATNGSALTGVIVVEEASGRRRGWEISAPEGPVLPGTSARALRLAAERADPGDMSVGLPFAIMLLAAFAGGLILNLMPCVLPVLAVKAAAVLGRSAFDAALARREAAAYVAGVVSFFVLIAVALVVLRAGGEAAGLGFHLQYPAVTTALSLIIGLIGFNLLGLFELPAVRFGGSLAGAPGAAGAFWTGALAALVGAPCVGPLLAAALAVVVVRPAPEIVFVFATIGVGMALPFACATVSPALAARVPAAGEWTLRLRRGLAFPMFASAAWLAWVLAGQLGDTVGFRLIMCQIALGFGLWFASVSPTVPARRVTGWLVAILAVIVAFTPAEGKGRGASPETGPWSVAAVESARLVGRPVFVDFTARWCLTCQYNRRTVLERPEIQRLFAERDTLFLTADWTNRDRVIAAELARFGRAGVPLYLYYPPEGEPVVLPTLLTPSAVRQVLEAPRPHTLPLSSATRARRGDGKPMVPGPGRR